MTLQSRTRNAAITAAAMDGTYHRGHFNSPTGEVTDESPESMLALASQSVGVVVVAAGRFFDSRMAFDFLVDRLAIRLESTWVTLAGPSQRIGTRANQKRIEFVARPTGLVPTCIPL
ncbi:MAG: hypothetical protein KDB00_08650 [Planctomycetales bacterium]|nr:hypothetical protein [Planctomycetales bacterium]